MSRLLAFAPAEGADENRVGCCGSLDSLLRFWQDVEQSAVMFAVGHHPLARTRHEVADAALKGLPATTRAANQSTATPRPRPFLYHRNQARSL